MICPKCNWWDRLCHCGELTLFNTTKDKLFHFTDEVNFREPIEIRGKDHFDKLCKQKGITWRDIKQSPRKVQDLKKEEYKPVPRKFIADAIRQELQSKGLSGKLLKRR